MGRYTEKKLVEAKKQKEKPKNKYHKDAPGAFHSLQKVYTDNNIFVNKSIE